MKTKLKYLFLAMLGLILIPTTNALNLDFSIDSSDSKFSEEMRNISYWFGSSRWSDFSPVDSSDVSAYSFTKNLYRDFILWYLNPNSSYGRVYWVYAYDEWEARIFYWSKFDDAWKQSYNKITFPSRTAYSYTLPNWEKAIFTEIFFYFWQFTLYDPISKHTLTFHWNNKIIDWIILSNPKKNEDNVYLLDLHHQKAWSLSVPKEKAWSFAIWRWLGESTIKNLKFTKSYSLQEWGIKRIPGDWNISFQWRWFQYIEDIEFTAPDWNAGKPNNQQTGDNQGLAEYNACYSYYSAIKHYTSYDYNCYKTLLDSAPLTGQSDLNQLLKPWNDIQTWDWEWNIAIQTKNIACHTLIKLKKEYKQQYKEKRGEFLKISSENFFYPHSMDIKGYCGERPKVDKVEWWLIQSMKNWFEWFRDRFNWNSGDPITVYSGKNYYKLDYDSALADLKVEYSHCKGMWGFRELIVDKDTIESEKKRACERYELKKKEFNKIFWGLKWVVNSTWAIQKIEDWNATDIGQGQKFVNVITDPYYSGFNSVNLVPALCSGPKNDFFNIFFYLFFFGVVLYLFKIFT